ncbi:MAG: transposase [Ferrimicrobium sp.]
MADVIIAETEAYMSRSPTSDHMASWAGICPDSNESADRVRSTHTRPGNPYLKGALTIAAMSAAHSHNTYYFAKYRRLTARRGPIKKAVVAIEHAMLVAIWNVLKTGETYSDPGDDFYTRRSRHKAESRAIEQLRNLGYTITLKPTAEVS